MRRDKYVLDLTTAQMDAIVKVIKDKGTVVVKLTDAQVIIVHSDIEPNSVDFIVGGDRPVTAIRKTELLSWCNRNIPSICRSLAEYERSMN